MSDRRIRALERAAHGGDEEAELRLYELRLRQDLCTDCGLTLDRRGAVCRRCALGEIGDIACGLTSQKRGKTHLVLLYPKDWPVSDRYETLCRQPKFDSKDTAFWPMRAGLAREVTCDTCHRRLYTLKLEPDRQIQARIRNLIAAAALGLLG